MHSKTILNRLAKSATVGTVAGLTVTGATNLVRSGALKDSPQRCSELHPNATNAYIFEMWQAQTNNNLYLNLLMFLIVFGVTASVYFTADCFLSKRRNEHARLDDILEPREEDSAHQERSTP